MSLHFVVSSADAGQAGLRADTNQYFAYVGTLTGLRSKGVYVCRFDATSGRLTEPELAAEIARPGFLTVDPRAKCLFATTEATDAAGKRTSALAAFSIDRETGRLAPLNTQPCGGSGVCHVSVDKTGRWALAANYASGSVVVLAVTPEGRLGERAAFIQHEGSSVHKTRQTKPYAHYITTDPANRFALVCDLGMDKVMVYRFDAVNGSLTANDPPCVRLAPGSGPRHLDFHPNGRFAYVLNEISSTITAFAYDAGPGALKELETISGLPAGFTNANTAAEIQVHPSGKCLYASNRGHNSIAVFAINPETGKLTFVEHQPTQGRNPRFAGLDPTGKFLLVANQDSDSVVVFRVDAGAGRLTPTGQSVRVPSPVCLSFVGRIVPNE